MKLDNLDNFKRSWIIGNFEPSLLKNNLEVGIQSYIAGTIHAAHYHLKCDEINVVLDGQCKFRFIEKLDVNNCAYSTDILCLPNDIITVNAGEIVEFSAVSNCRLLVIKTNSDPNDKYEI